MLGGNFQKNVMSWVVKFGWGLDGCARRRNVKIGLGLDGCAQWRKLTVTVAIQLSWGVIFKRIYIVVALNWVVAWMAARGCASNDYNYNIKFNW